jgi:hypothetical protein
LAILESVEARRTIRRHQAGRKDRHRFRCCGSRRRRR